MQEDDASAPTTSISDHVLAATDMIGTMARATVDASRAVHGRKATRKRLAHVEAAGTLAIAAGAYFAVAQRVAEGRTYRDLDIVLEMRIAEAKVVEALQQMGRR